MPSEQHAITIPSVQTSVLRATGDNLVLAKPSKTGATRLIIERQKEFVERKMKEDTQLTRNGAKRLYEAYRVETSKGFTNRVAQQLVAGNLLVKSASISKGGAVRGVSFMTPKESSAVRVADAAFTIGKEHGLSDDVVRAIVAAAKQRQKSQEAETVDVEATESHSEAKQPEAVAASA